MKIAVIGTGYVGLVSAACLARKDLEVICYDIDKKKINSLKSAKIPFFEPGLEKLVKENKYLSFTNSLKDSLKNADACFITVGTPHNKELNEPDLSFFYQAVNSIIENISNDILIINKSTLPINTSAELVEYIHEKKAKYKISVALNPEFLSQGSAVKDFLNPKRIVLGAEHKKDFKILEKIYEKFINRGVNIVKTNIGSAELIKYGANAFLAMKVSFINELSQIAPKINADIREVSKAIGLDDRIGSKFLNAGPGYGGSCFPKDTEALEFAAHKLAVNVPLLSSINKANENIVEEIAIKMINLIKKEKFKKIAFFGLAFKANTDDLRDSQSIKIIKLIRKKLKDVEIIIHDPKALDKAKLELKKEKVRAGKSIEKIIKESDLYIFMTEWEDYKKIKFSKTHKAIIDCRNLFPKLQKSKNYYSLGKNF